MKKKEKTKKFGFRQTFLYLRLWYSSVFFHLATFYLAYLSLPRDVSLSPTPTPFIPIQQGIQSVVQTTKETLVPKEGKPLSPYFLAQITQILIFNIFFLLIYYFTNKINRKIFNPLAIYLVGVIASFVFMLIARIT